MRRDLMYNGTMIERKKPHAATWGFMAVVVQLVGRSPCELATPVQFGSTARRKEGRDWFPCWLYTYVGRGSNPRRSTFSTVQVYIGWRDL